MVVIGRKLYHMGNRWLPMLLWMGFIYAMSGQQSQQIPSFGLWDTLVKKGAHFLAYALLAYLALRAVSDSRYSFALAFLVVLAYAISDEWHQSFVATRNGRLSDVIIDTAGAAVALLMLHQGKSRSDQQSPQSG